MKRMRKKVKKISRLSFILLLVGVMILTSAFSYSNLVRAEEVGLNESITSVKINGESDSRVNVKAGQDNDFVLHVTFQKDLKSKEAKITIPDVIDVTQGESKEIRAVINNKDVKVGSYDIVNSSIDLSFDDVSTKVQDQNILYIVDMDIAFQGQINKTGRIEFNSYIQKDVTVIGERFYSPRSAMQTETVDLNQLVTGVEISGLVQGADGKYIAKAGQEYTFNIQFKERENCQFANDNEMVYTIPEELADVNLLTNGEFVIRITDDAGIVHEIEGNKYRIEDGKIIVNFNTEDSEYDKLIAAGNVGFQIQLKAKFDSSKEKIEISFGTEVKKEVTIEQPVNNVTVNKWATFEDGKIKYAIEVKATGDNNTNIKVDDTLSSTEFIKINNDVKMRF